MVLKNKKSLGQHWLKNRAILDEIARLAAVPGVETCLEIGPGLGTLTSSLFKYFSAIVAVEFDADLARKLPASFPGKHLRVENADILAIDVRKVLNTDRYVVAGNIPYYITSPIIHKFLTVTPRPQKIVLLVQKEVAERVAADAGRASLLSLSVQNLAEVELGPIVPAAEFTPPPKVDSEVLVLTPLESPVVDPSCLELAKVGFSSPRKKLCANLAAAPSSKHPAPSRSKAEWRALLESQGISPDARAGDLSLWDWEALAGQKA